MPPVKSDAGWLEDFRARYARWIPEARPLLERHDYAADPVMWRGKGLREGSNS
jgi:hypothetical protein